MRACPKAVQGFYRCPHFRRLTEPMRGRATDVGDGVSDAEPRGPERCSLLADEQLAERLILIRLWRDLPIHLFGCGIGHITSWLQGDGAMARAHVLAQSKSSKPKFKFDTETPGLSPSMTFHLKDLVREHPEANLHEFGFRNRRVSRRVTEVIGEYGALLEARCGLATQHETFEPREAAASRSESTCQRRLSRAIPSRSRPATSQSTCCQTWCRDIERYLEDGQCLRLSGCLRT